MKFSKWRCLLWSSVAYDGQKQESTSFLAKESDFKFCVFKTAKIKKWVVLLQTHFQVMFMSYISLFFELSLQFCVMWHFQKIVWLIFFTLPPSWGNYETHELSFASAIHNSWWTALRSISWPPPLCKRWNS